MNETGQEPPWFDGIEGDDARRLISSDEPLIRVVAGPGAGKTTCLKRRTQRLINGQGVPPDRVFVGTFTRAIAQDLRRELGEDIAVSTLHSLAYRLLRENPAACQGMRLRFLLKYEEDSMLYDIADRVAQDDQSGRRSALLRLQSSRSERQDFADAAFAGAVREWLQGHGGMLVGEVVYLATTGLEAHDIPPGEFDHVVVDEYQDLTAAEQDLVEQVWSRAGSLIVMGDNDQSIYSFRFNHPEGIEEFSDRWTTGEVVDLGFTDNRRCGKAILHVANLMMAEAGSAKAPMVHASGRPGEVALVHWEDSAAEIAGLAQFVSEQADDSFLVLVPRRFIGYRLKEAIGDDARTAFREEVLDHQVAQERFALGSAISDPTDMIAIRSWLGFAGNRPEQAQRRNAVAYASLPPGFSGPELIAQIATGEIEVRGSGSRHLKQRAEALEAAWHEELAGDAEQAITVLFDPSLAEVEGDPERRRWLANDLAELRDAGLAILRGQLEPSLPKVLQALRYRIATRAELIESTAEPRVRIMTLHSAKGLQADNIVIAGAADQMTPGMTEDQELVAEQRRLLYVAVTRARDRLIISWPRALLYEDAAANFVRNDQVVTRGGRRYVSQSRSTLLPQALPGGQSGQAWLDT